MTPEAFALRCQEIVTQSRGHTAHRALDLLTNDVLREAGYGEGIAIFEAAVAGWHRETDAYPYSGPCPDCEQGSMTMNNKAPLPVSDAAREFLAAQPHDLMCPARTSCGYCNCHQQRALAAIEAAMQAIRAEIGAKVEGLREALDMQGRALNAFLELIGSDELSPGVFGGNYHWLRDPTFEEGQAALEANNTAAAALSLLGHEPGEEGGR